MMRVALIMIVLQSISNVTPFSNGRKRNTVPHLRLLASRSDGTFVSLDSTVLEEDYVQRFTNVARLYENNVNTTLQSLRNAHVCVVGLGGVGSWCVEALARSGVSKFTLIDMDDICISNTNRQIQALTSTVGQFKGEALRNRILDINPYASVEILLDFLRPTNVDSIVATNILPPPKVVGLDENFSKTVITDGSTDNTADSSAEHLDIPYYLSGPAKFDYLVDAADGVTDKAFMIDACVRSGTPIVVCGGAGGLTDPTLLRISDLTKVVGDNLIMHVRKKLRQKFGYPQGVQMSAARKSKENGSKKDKPKQVKKWNIQTIHTMPTGVKRGVPKDGADVGDFRKCDVSFGNSCFSTGTVGFLMASVVVNYIAGEKIGSRVPTALGLVGRNRGPVPLKGVLLKSAINSSQGDGIEDGNEKGTGKEVDAASGVFGGQLEGSECASAGGGEKSSSDTSLTSPNRESVISEVMSQVCEGSNRLLSSTVLVDAHCHLQLDPLYSRAEEAILTAKSNTIAFAVVCGTCPGSDWDRVRDLHLTNGDFIMPQFGLHPWWISRHLETVNIQTGSGSSGSSVDELKISFDSDSPSRDGTVSDWEMELDSILSALPMAGVGECGLDSGLKNVDMSLQAEMLRKHMRIAARHNRSVTMHCVGAWAKLLEIMKEMEKEIRSTKKSTDAESDRNIGVRAYVLHSCNSLPVQMVGDFLKIPNVYFSFSGRALREKQGKLASKIPMDRLLVETDSPDQVPLSLASQMQSNEPSLVRLNLVNLANLLAVDPNILAAATVMNARTVFDYSAPR